MQTRTVPARPDEWQRMANDLLGANLVGNVCGKKSPKQAYRWAMAGHYGEAQNGPLAHVMGLCSKLAGMDDPAGDMAAMGAARLLVEHLAGLGLPVRLAVDVPGGAADSASLESQRLHRAVSDAIQAGVEGKDPVLVAALVEQLVYHALRFRKQYRAEFEAGQAVRFCADLLAEPDGCRSGWKRFFTSIRKRVRG